VRLFSTRSRRCAPGPGQEFVWDYPRPPRLEPVTEGRAHYLTVRGGGRVEPDATWGYDDPSPGFEALAGHVAFYAGRMDACFVEGERVTPQSGGFYGGWITSTVAGPFKDGPGTRDW
jgi:Domain of unknown function (DUF427)